MCVGEMGEYERQVGFGETGVKDRCDGKREKLCKCKRDNYV